jgi:hypothetical protein
MKDQEAEEAFRRFSDTNNIPQKDSGTPEPHGKPAKELERDLWKLGYDTRS